jgi:polyisoprenoid-binding protein YceI
VSTIGTTTDLNRFTGTWTLDPQKTSIAFRTKAMWIFTVNGTAKALSGHAAADITAAITRMQAIPSG